MIDLRNTDAEALIASLEPGSVAGVIADPPWKYGSPREAVTRFGLGASIADKYDEMQDRDIVRILDSTYPLVGPNAYLAVWCTWPKMAEWSAVHESMRWRYVTGGCWAKANGFGVGFHAAGDSEFWLIYVKGSPRPAEGRR